MIAGIETGSGLPEDTLAEAEAFEERVILQMEEGRTRVVLLRALQMYTPQELFDMACSLSKPHGGGRGGPKSCSYEGLRKVAASPPSSSLENNEGGECENIRD
jgi:hypothetical protein